ncbi:unnamed protein product [Meganyctiphanes norvegica]|uniref:Fibronectin type-II domain-containing protein n=1 Tax=Meganyctiphanes norvegica TaxID=48144 RepID=A0AAV2S9U0_MEGNR
MEWPRFSILIVVFCILAPPQVVVQATGDVLQHRARRSSSYESGCVFPFRYNDMVFYRCTTVDANEPWCSTMTDSSANHVRGKWKYCQDHKPCLFPFVNVDLLYTNCRQAGWCSTRREENFKHVPKYWKLC